MNDIHKAKGQKIERLVKAALRRSGHADAVQFVNGLAVEVERSERAKARERGKRAAKHEKTKDIFDV